MMTSVQNSSSLSNAIHWWHGRLIQATHQKAETLRNGLLQDIFALRRSLELSYYAREALTLEQLQSGIEQLTCVHEQMADLSDELAPPQFDDLATALQQLLDRWQEQSSPCGNSVSYPMKLDKVVSDPSLNEMVVLVLTEWLRIVGAAAPINLKVSLHRGNQDIELLLQARLSEVSPFLPGSALKELNYLEQVFYQLTQGQYLQSLPQSAQGQEQGQEQELKGLFRWKITALADNSC